MTQQRGHHHLGAGLAGSRAAAHYRRRHAVAHLLVAQEVSEAEAVLADLPSYLDRFQLPRAEEALWTLAGDLFATTQQAAAAERLAPWQDWLQRNSALLARAEDSEEAVGMLVQTAVEHGWDSPVTDAGLAWFEGHGRDLWHFRSASIPKVWREGTAVARAFHVGGPVADGAPLRQVGPFSLACAREDGALVHYEVRTGRVTVVPDADLVALDQLPDGALVGLTRTGAVVRFEGAGLTREVMAQVDFPARTLCVVGGDVLVGGDGLARVDLAGHGTPHHTTLSAYVRAIHGMCSSRESTVLTWGPGALSLHDVRRDAVLLARDLGTDVIWQVLPLDGGAFLVLSGPTEPPTEAPAPSGPAVRWEVFAANGTPLHDRRFDGEAPRPVRVARREGGGLWVAFSDGTLREVSVGGDVQAGAARLDHVTEGPGRDEEPTEAPAAREWGHEYYLISDMCETRSGALVWVYMDAASRNHDRGWAVPVFDGRATGVPPHPKATRGLARYRDACVSWDIGGHVHVWRRDVKGSEGGVTCDGLRAAGLGWMSPTPVVGLGPLRLVATRTGFALALADESPEEAPGDADPANHPEGDPDEAVDLQVQARHFGLSGLAAVVLNPDGSVGMKHRDADWEWTARLYRGARRAVVDDLLEALGRPPLDEEEAARRAGFDLVVRCMLTSERGRQVMATLPAEQASIMRMTMGVHDGACKVPRVHGRTVLLSGVLALCRQLAVARLQGNRLPEAVAHLDRGRDTHATLVAKDLAYVPETRRLAAATRAVADALDAASEGALARTLRARADALDAQASAQRAHERKPPEPDARPTSEEELLAARERIRQIEAKALRKLRHPGQVKKLSSYKDT
jgi:hypothetical protein